MINVVNYIIIFFILIVNVKANEQDSGMLVGQKKAKEDILRQYQQGNENDINKTFDDSPDDFLSKTKGFLNRFFKYKPYIGVEHVFQNFDIIASGVENLTGFKERDGNQIFRAIEANTEVTDLKNTRAKSRGVTVYAGMKFVTKYGFFVAPEVYYTGFYYNDYNGIDLGVGGILAEISFKYDWGIRFNAGFNLGEMFSIYGVGGLGVLGLQAGAPSLNLSVSVPDAQAGIPMIPVPFYGIGASFVQGKFEVNAKYIQRVNFTIDENLNSLLGTELGDAMIKINSNQYVLGVHYRFFA